MASTITKIIRVDTARAVKDSPYARSFSSTPSFVVYNERFQRDILGQTPTLTQIETRDYQFAHEAGVYHKATNSVYFTANFQTCDPVHLYAVDCGTHAVTQVNYKDVVQANGACQYRTNLLYCSQGDRDTPSALVLVDPVTEESDILVNNFHGRGFSSVNDVVENHQTGDIWFTDPYYGYFQGFRPDPRMPVHVYRFRPSTHEIWTVADGFEQCNGLCFSPDYKVLYVTDTGAVQAHGGVGDGHNFSVDQRKPATIYVYDVVEGKRLRNRRTFAFCDTGIPDGIKCDELGNVYLGCGDGVHVWDPEGTLIGKIVVGGVTANFCFGPKGTMWMFAEEALYVCQLKVPGALVKIECE